MAAIARPDFLRTRNRVLVASADALFRRRLMSNPNYAGTLNEEAVGGAHALVKLGQVPCDSVLLDRHLPDLDASEVAALIRKRFPQVEVEFVDSKLIASQPQDTEICDHLAQSESGGSNIPDIPETCAKREPICISQGQRGPVDALPRMIGMSPAIQQVYRLVRMVAARDTIVLITGETGTGKELVAQAIHELSRRSRHPFVVVNCAAIPETLLEAELFGHARGAFTGAVQSRLGRIHVAQGGTLFLDEIGELPLMMQAKLLRFLQNGEVQRLGSSDVHRVDVRVVCATNVNLLELVRAKQFRQDLYYRLNIFPVAIPPLRDRRDDIENLAAHFLEILSAEVELPKKQLSAAALALLQKGEWAGNVRELQHTIERAFILSGNDVEIGAEHFQVSSEIFTEA